MPKIFIRFLILISISSMSFALEVQKNPIVDINQVQSFGIWRIYNAGDKLYLIDSLKGRIVEATTLNYYPSSEDDFFYFFFSHTGSASSTSGNYPNKAAAKATQTPNAIIQDGFFGYQNTRLSIEGDNMSIFPISNNNYDAINNTARFKMVLNKYSNRIFVKGPDTETNFEPNVTVTSSNMPTAVRTLGNCAANYNPATGTLTVPCFTIGDERTIYEIDLKQFPDTLNFGADLPSFKTIQ